jgi:hypothetical protein
MFKFIFALTASFLAAVSLPQFYNTSVSVMLLKIARARLKIISPMKILMH